MGVTNFLTIAVRGSKSDIKDLHKRLMAFENEGKVTMDYRTMALVRMIDDWYGVVFCGIELKSPTLVEFCTVWEKRLPLGEIINQLKSAYDETDVFFYINNDNMDYPIVYDPGHEIFEFDEPAFYLEEDYDLDEWDSEDDTIWAEYQEWCENLTEDNDGA